jgi:metallo-beta-lactamase family protein
LLPDSGHIQEEDAIEANKYHFSKHHPALPLYTMEDGKKALYQFHPIPFNEPHQLFDSLSVTLFPAGHIIGSSLIKLESKNKTIIFTGDLGRPNDPIMKPPAIMTNANYLVVESTYGDRLHEQADPLDQIADAVQTTLAKGGSVIIPAFAVGRTQDLLYFLYLLRNTQRIPDVPIFLDSPMAQNVSDLLIHHVNEHRLTAQQCKDLCAIARYVKTPDESKAIDQLNTPAIIISASGMIEGGRILHHLKIALRDHRNTILLTGYQAPGTRGDRLIQGESEIKIHGEMIPVRAKIIALKNMSAHADYNEMLDWLKNFTQKPQKVFITHGDQNSSLSLKNKIEQKFGWKCEIPDYLQTEVLM